MNEWILTAIPVPDAGVVMFKPGVGQLKDFKGRMVIMPAPIELQSLKSGRVSSKQSLLNDKRLLPFFDNEIVFAAAGGSGGLHHRISQNIKHCQIEDDDFHHDELTLTKVGNSYIRTCWHHDTEIIKHGKFKEQAEQIAKENYHSNILWAISNGLRYSSNHHLSLGDLFTWTVQHQISHLLPDLCLRQLLNIGATPTHDGPILTPSETASSKVKRVLAFDIDDEPPASFMKRPKLIRWQNTNYLKWVKSQQCCGCDMPADDPHHIIGHGQGGMGTKAHDLFTIPLCRKCHDELHRDPKEWERIHGSQVVLLFKFLDRSIGLGVFG